VLEATDLHPGRTGHDHLRVLAALPLAVFAMGPLTLEADDVAGSRKQLDRALANEPSLEPIAVVVFGGVVDPTKMRFPFTHMDASDARDWDAIRYWTDDIAGLNETRRSRLATEEN
jgi:menaquinone-dependent protoporphyrinogen IX oxidase